MGTLEPRKNLPTLLDAWREVRRHHEWIWSSPAGAAQIFGELPRSRDSRAAGEVPDAACPPVFERAGLRLPFALRRLRPSGARSDAVRRARDRFIGCGRGGGDAAMYADNHDAICQRDDDELRNIPSVRAELRAASLARAAQFSWERTARLTHDVYLEARRALWARDPDRRPCCWRPRLPTPWPGGEPCVLPPFCITWRAATSRLDRLPQPGAPDPSEHLPAGLVTPRHGDRSCQPIGGVSPRALRNAGRWHAAFLRWWIASPVLRPVIEAALAGSRYDIGVIEHSWCAPYLPVIARVSRRTVLDLHNVESPCTRDAPHTEGCFSALPIVYSGTPRCAGARLAAAVFPGAGVF